MLVQGQCGINYNVVLQRKLSKHFAVVSVAKRSAFDAGQAFENHYEKQVHNILHFSGHVTANNFY